MKNYLRTALIFITTIAASPASAHVGIGETSAFAAGVTHPLGGYDHLLAMVAVGLWAALRGQQALWLWPLAFVGSMVAGGALGMNGIALPLVEHGILASVMALGLAVAFAMKAPLPMGAVIIGLAGLLHGYTHGAEAPSTGDGLLYAAGFVLATALLHGAGVGLGILADKLGKPALVRVAGGLIALAGAVFVFTGA